MSRERPKHAPASSRDAAALSKLFVENVLFRTPENSPLAGEYRSRDAMFVWFDRVGKLSGGPLQMKVHDT